MKIKTIRNWTHADGRQTDSATLIRVGHDFVVVDDPYQFAHDIINQLENHEHHYDTTRN